MKTKIIKWENGRAVECELVDKVRNKVVSVAELLKRYKEAGIIVDKVKGGINYATS